MKRRQFLKNTGKAVTVPMMLNGMGMTALSKSLFDFINNDNDRVLVIIQMNGGNDGLNMVIPIDRYPNLSNARSNILIPENKVLKLTTETGLNPAMQVLGNLFSDGKMSVVQSVGYPNQNRSHFRSKDIWNTASAADEYLQTGWLGRYFEIEHPEFPIGYPNDDFRSPFAITMGKSSSETCQGTVSNFSMTLSDPFSLSPLFEGIATPLVNTYYHEELEYIRTTIFQTNLYSGLITDAADAGTNSIEYPDTKLGEQLKNIALLISGGLETKIYVANIGGFDTHSNQVNSDTTTGKHADLLEELSSAISAFQMDLQEQNLEERVIGMTYSEFGRRILSNGSNGTDHGTAAPLFLFGSCVNPMIHGDNPDIPMTPEPQEGVAMQIDFRDVYGSILVDWFNVDENFIRSSINPNFQKLPVTVDCSSTSTQEEDFSRKAKVKVYPNPAIDYTEISFELEEKAKSMLTIFNAEGLVVRQVFNKDLSTGSHAFKVDLAELPAGNYYYRLLVGNQATTKHFVKIR